MLIRRSWHDVEEMNLKNGCCPKCGLPIPGRWENSEAKGSKQIAREAAELGARYDDLNL
jgi:ribosomal protein L37AE/L43A